MSIPKNRYIDIIYFIAFLAFDIFIYMVLGLLLMNHDDKQLDSGGLYGNFQGMPGFDKMIYIVFLLWSLLNLFIVIYLISRLIKYFKKPRVDNN